MLEALARAFNGASLKVLRLVREACALVSPMHTKLGYCKILRNSWVRVTTPECEAG